MTQKSKKIISIFAILMFIVLSGLIFYFVGIPLVKYANEPEKFRELVNDNGVLGRMAFIGMTVLQVVVAIIPGEPFEILAGYAFGAVEGTLLCVIAQTLGSIIVFKLVKVFGIKIAEIFFSREKLDSLTFLKTSAKRDTVFLIIFMIPGTPKDLITYFAGLTDMKMATWLLICSFGRLPAIITSSVGGDALGTNNYLFAALVFGITFIVSLIGIFIYNKICKKNENLEKSE